MYFQFYNTLSILLAYCTVSSAAASADCFTGIGSSYTTSSDASARITAGFTCSNSTCTIRSGGYVKESSTLNITTRHTTEVLGTIGRAFNVSFNEVKYEQMNAENIFGPRQNGYIIYNYSLLCYLGVIEKHCFDDIPAGTPVMACRPRSQAEDPNGPNYRDGHLTFVETDEATARSITDNPALTLKLPDDNGTNNNTNATNATIYSSTESAAINLLGQGGWRSSILTTAIVMTVTKTGEYLIAF